MYAEHVPMINDAMRADADTFARGLLFSILSARQPIQHVPEMLRDIDRNGEDAEALALPRKFEGFLYLQEHARELWRDVTGFRLDETRDALQYLTKVPGLGIVKSAFALQFLGHDIGCLDTHNLRREKIPERAFTCHGDGQVNGYRLPQFDRYMSLAFGRARELWDTWCNQLAGLRDMLPEEVSALHLAILPDDMGRKLQQAEIPF